MAENKREIVVVIVTTDWHEQALVFVYKLTEIFYKNHYCNFIKF